jgi:hypothetical protein
MKTQILSILFLAIFIPKISNACDCPQAKNLKSVQNQEFENSDCILIGEVLEFDSEIGTFKVKVIESFSGDENGKIYNGICDEYCGPLIDQKGKWLIYGNINQDGFLAVSICGLTRSFENPENNFQILVLDYEITPDIETEKEKTERIKKAKSDLIDEIELLRTKTK